MNILLIAADYPPVLNSAARLFSELASGLRGRGHAVTVLTDRSTRYLDEKSRAATVRPPSAELRDGVGVIRMRRLPWPKHVPGFRAVEQLVSLPRFYLRGRRLGHFDVIIAYSPPLPLAVAAILLACRRAKAIVNLQDPYPSSAVDLGLLTNRMLIRAGEWMERWVYRGADAITVHSEGMREHVIARGGSAGRTHTIQNWIDLKWFSPGESQGTFRRRLELGEKTVVSYAGVMGFGQQVEDILEAAAILQDTLPDVFFVLAGEGVARQRLEKRATEMRLDNVRFLPHLSESDYLELLRASDVCLVTLANRLKSPVIPGKLACIMGVGKAVVCSVPETSGAKRLVEEVGCGRWVESGKPSDLASALRELAGDPELRNRLGARGREHAVRWFSALKGIERYDELARELADPDEA